MRVFSAYFWHSEAWTPRNVALLVAVMKRVKVTTHHWSIACDANMCPEDFEKSLWFQKEQLCVVAPKEASTCRSKGSKGSGLKEPMIMSLRVTASGENLTDEGGGRFRVEAARKQRPLWSREKRQKRRKRRTAEKDKSGMKSPKKWLRAFKKKLRAHVDAKPTVHRTVGQSIKQNWDCSQIENVEEEEDEDWHEGDQMKEQWDEDEKLEEILEQRRVDGGSLQAEVMQKVPELVVRERMSQGKQGESCGRKGKSERMVH